MPGKGYWPCISRLLYLWLHPGDFSKTCRQSNQPHHRLILLPLNAFCACSLVVGDSSVSLLVPSSYKVIFLVSPGSWSLSPVGWIAPTCLPFSLSRSLPLEKIWEYPCTPDFLLPHDRLFFSRPRRWNRHAVRVIIKCPCRKYTRSYGLRFVRRTESWCGSFPSFLLCRHKSNHQSKETKLRLLCFAIVLPSCHK